MSIQRKPAAYLALGHVSADRGTASGPLLLGGSVSYAAQSAAGLGWSPRVVTRGQPDFIQANWPLPAETVELLSDTHTTSFRQRYAADGQREQHLEALAGPLHPSDVPEAWRQTDILHVAPIADELPEDGWESIGSDFIGLTPQGWLRRLSPGSPVLPGPWRCPDALLESATALVVSEEDLVGVSGGEAWLRHDMIMRTNVLVVTRADRGATAFAEGKVLEQPALPTRSIDPTGAGDVFASSLFIRLWESGELGHSLRFATAAASLSLRERGLHGIPSRSDIESALAHWPAH